MKDDKRKTYTYEGPVFHFENIVNSKWKGNTTAVSPKQALSNLSYKYKMSAGLVTDSKITLKEKYLKVF